VSDDGKIKGLAAELVGSKQRPRDWRFRDREDAARAVLAESLRGQGEKTEARLAGEVLSNEHITPHILADLKRYAAKLQVYVRDLQDSHYVKEDFIAKQGKYSYYYAGLLGRTKMGTVLQEAAAQTKVEPLIAAIKDVSSEMYTWMEEELEKVGATGYNSLAYQEANSAINAPAAMSVANTPAAFAFVAPTIEDIGTVVRPDGVLSEKSDSMKFARKKMMLVDHGPSFSTARVLQLGRKIHATIRTACRGVVAFRLLEQGILAFHFGHPSLSLRHGHAEKLRPRRLRGRISGSDRLAQPVRLSWLSRGLWNKWTESAVRRFDLRDRVGGAVLLWPRCPALRRNSVPAY
jgi:hypothetical protein